LQTFRKQAGAQNSNVLIGKLIRGVNIFLFSLGYAQFIR